MKDMENKSQKRDMWKAKQIYTDTLVATLNDKGGFMVMEVNNKDLDFISDNLDWLKGVYNQEENYQEFISSMVSYEKNPVEAIADLRVILDEIDNKVDKVDVSKLPSTKATKEGKLYRDTHFDSPQVGSDITNILNKMDYIEIGPEVSNERKLRAHLNELYNRLADIEVSKKITLKVTLSGYEFVKEPLTEAEILIHNEIEYVTNKLRLLMGDRLIYKNHD